MEKNAVVLIIEKIVGTDKIEYISGEIKNCGTKECELTGTRGSVYGVAIKLKGSEKDDFFNNLINKKKNIKKEKWVSIGEDFYPLYWGIDINMGSRLTAHINSYSGTGALQLNGISMGTFQIVYGAMPCLNREIHEKTLKKRFPDILKTRK